MDRLSVSYDHRRETTQRALQYVSLRIAPGEGVGLLGESGSGKSTLALALLGLLPGNANVSAGGIRFRGRDLLCLEEEDLRKVRGAQIAYIFQEPATALNPVMRVGVQISEVLLAHRLGDRRRRRDAAEEILREVGLNDVSRIYSSYPHELSGGEQQRVAIAQALACRPALLIADEPVSALDATTRAEVLSCLRDVKARLNTAILMITHDPATLVGLADRVVVLHNGELVDETNVDEVLEQPTQLFTQAVLSALFLPPPSNATAESGRALTGSSPDSKPARSCPSRPGHVPLLVAKRLRKRYEKGSWLTGACTHAVQALDGVDLILRPGRTTCLVGESGSGKSTLARCLALLEHPDSGEVRLEGSDLLRLSSSEMRKSRRSIQMVLQNAAAAFNPLLTLEDTIAEPLCASGWTERARRDHAVALMKEVGLPDSWRLRRPHELSGGERQRLAIARALAAGPAVLIFDEALNGLDWPVQARIVELLLRLQSAQALAYLFITHDLRLAGYIADEVAVMQGGRIVEQGPVGEVFGCPRHAHTQSLLESVPSEV